MPSATATVTMTLRPTSNKATNGYTNTNLFTNGVRKFRLDPIPEALVAFQKGEFVVVVDDESRENEGDLIIAASHITTQKMAWFIKHTSCAFVSIWALNFSQNVSSAYRSLQWVYLYIITGRALRRAPVASNGPK